MINILITASVTGGIVILLWYLSYPLSKKYFKASWHYVILKITMLFLIFPLSIFAPNFNSMISGLSAKLQHPNISEHIQTVNINTETINSVLSNIVFSDNINYTDNIIGNEIGNANSDFPYLQILWLIVAVIMLSGGLLRMYRFRKEILSRSNGNVNRETLDLFLQCKKELKVRGRINLRTSEYIKTPLAFGLINPLVILPETDMTANEKKLAFIHELTHIKNGDLWMKFLVFVISSVHWFNPLVYLLRRKTSVISEEYCDECVIKKMEKQERLLYGNLILKVVSDVSMPEFCSTLSASTKNIKRRLFKMINLKKSRKGVVALSIITALIMCSLATVYALSSNEDAPETEGPAIETPVYDESSPETTSDIDIPSDDSDEYYYLYLESNPEVVVKVPKDAPHIGYFGPDMKEVLYHVSRTYIPTTDDGEIIDDDWNWEVIGTLTYEEYRTFINDVMNTPVPNTSNWTYMENTREASIRLCEKMLSTNSYSGDGENSGRVSFDRGEYFYDIFIIK